MRPWVVLDEVVFVASVLATPLTCIAIATIVLWYTDQFGELLLSALTDPGGSRRLYWAMVLFVVGGAITTFYASALLSGYATRNQGAPQVSRLPTGREQAERAQVDRDQASREQAARRSERILNWRSFRFAVRDATPIYRYAPIVVGVAFIGLPLLVMWLRYRIFLHDQVFLSSAQAERARHILNVATSMAGIGVIPVVLLGMAERMATHIAERGGLRVKYTRLALMLAVAPVTVVAICAGILLHLRFDPTGLASKYGAISVFAAVLWCYCVVLLILSELGQRSRLPLVWGATLFVILCGLAGWFNRYTFEPPSAAAMASAPEDRASSSDPDCEFRNPVERAVCDWRRNGVPRRRFIVAAQGGGAYAAYHTALTLARLQDQCGKLHKNILALSGVSGGSLGVAVYLAAVDAVKRMYPGVESASSEKDRCSGNGNAPGAHELLIQRFFQSDLLTPVIAAGLLIDLPHHLVPYKLLPGAWPDRGKVLENAIIAAWQSVLDTSASGIANFFSLPLAELNGDLTSGAVPFFGSMLAETGEPVVLSPLYFARHSPLTQRFFHIEDILGRSGLTVASAVVLSARFPLITPAARVVMKTQIAGLPETVSLLDGGVFENSGLKLARELHGAFLDAPACRHDEGPRRSCRYVPELIMIAFGHVQDAPYRTHIFSEVMTPILALLNAKTARGFDYGREVKTIVGKENLEDVIEFQLGDTLFAPPLGWALSGVTRRRIEARSGLTWPDNAKASKDHEAMKREHSKAMLVLDLVRSSTH